MPYEFLCTVYINTCVLSEYKYFVLSCIAGTSVHSTNASIYIANSCSHTDVQALVAPSEQPKVGESLKASWSIDQMAHGLESVVLKMEVKTDCSAFATMAKWNHKMVYYILFLFKCKLA